MTLMQHTGATYLKGALLGLAAVSIWAGWSAATRLAVTTSLDAWDIAALRFGVAGVLLFPIVVRRGLARDDDVFSTGGVARGLARDDDRVVQRHSRGFHGPVRHVGVHDARPP